MTIGEKIQFYRKKNGLSQEELGQKLLVSRQTVSLWEMNKTLPTIDNLILLKEVFSVSVDDILCEDETIIEENTEIASEAYVFKYEKNDLRRIFKKSCFPLVKNFIIFIISCLFLFVIVAASDTDIAILGIVFGIFLFGIEGRCRDRLPHI